MRIALVCSDPAHPVMPWLARWRDRHGGAHEIALHRRASELGAGDLLFLVSCTEMIGPEVRARFGHVLVLHASDLPEGRGWSPHVWAILAGAEEITVSLLEATEPVDSGAIWAKRRVAIPRHALHDEIHAALFDAELALMDEALRLAADPQPEPQPEEGATWHRRRRPADSEIDPERSIAAQWDALRIADPERYPAFFRLHGHRYAITLRKLDDAPDRD